MTRLRACLARFVREEDGPSATEYAVMLALIVVVCIGALSQYGTGLSSLNTISNAMLFAGS